MISSFQSIKNAAHSIFTTSPQASQGSQEIGAHSQTKDVPASPPPPNRSERTQPAPKQDSLPSRPVLSRERRVQRSEDERALYGDYRVPADATPIRPPGVLSPVTMKPGAGSSFRPSNNIDQPSPWSSRGSRQQVYGKHTGLRYDGLPFVHNFGDNVTRRDHGEPFDIADHQRTSHKRRKIERPATSDAHPVSFVDLTGPENDYVPTTRTVSRVPPEENNHFQSYTSRSTQTGERRNSAAPFSLNEFHSVERMMNPTRKTSFQSSSQNGASQERSLSHDSSAGVTKSKHFPMSIEVSDEEQLVHQPSTNRREGVSYRLHDATRSDDEGQQTTGANNKDWQAAQSIRSFHPATGDINQLSRNQAAHGTPRPASHVVSTANDFTKTLADSKTDLGVFNPAKLRQQKDSSVPKPMEINESDDELEVVEPRSNKPKDLLRDEKMEEQNRLKDNWDIPRSRFTSSKTKASLEFPRKPKRSTRWELKTLKIPGDVLAQPNLTLVPDVRAETYIVCTEDGPVPLGNGNLTIDPKKINKVMYSESDSAKLVVTGSRDGKFVYQLAVEFANSDQCHDFVRALEEDSGSVNVWGKSPGQMERIFEKHSSIMQNESYLRSEAVDTGEEVALLQSREDQRPRRMADRSNESERLNPARPRRTLVSQMQPDFNRDASTIRTFRTVDSRESAKMNGAMALDTIGGRTTRSSNRTERPSSYYKEPSPELRKYSETHGFGKPWTHPVVYPPTGRQRASVEYDDLFRLDDGEFLNDSIISFYMTWAATQAREQGLPERKFYYFNTYFYTALTNVPRGQKGINYAAVQRWTAKIDLFKYDYIAVPVNEEAHWYLAIICNLPNINKAIQQRKDQEAQEDQQNDRPESLAAQVRLALNPDNPSEPGKEPAPEPMDIDPPRMQNVADNMPTEKSSELSDGKQHGTSIYRLSNLDGASTPIELLDSQENSTATRTNTESESAKPSPNNKKSKKKKGGPNLRTYEPDEPIIIVLDSLGLIHTKTARHLKEYLVEEGRTKHKLSFEIEDIKAMNPSRSIPLQGNYCDCGVFLLGYIKKFLEDPDLFTRRILTREMTVDQDWPDMDPSKLRVTVIELLMGLERDQSRQRREEKKKRLADKQEKGSKGSSTPEAQEEQIRQLKQTSEPLPRPGSPEVRIATPAKQNKNGEVLQSSDKKAVESRDDVRNVEDDEMLLDPREETVVEILDSQPQPEQQASDGKNAWVRQLRDTQNGKDQIIDLGDDLD